MAYIDRMSNRHVTIHLTSPSGTLSQTLPVDVAIARVSSNIPAPELEDALRFLDMENMAEGFYKGTNWTLGFAVAEEAEDPSRDATDSTRGHEDPGPST